MGGWAVGGALACSSILECARGDRPGAGQRMRASESPMGFSKIDLCACGCQERAGLGGFFGDHYRI
jgi:hypothetical protein